MPDIKHILADPNRGAEWLYQQFGRKLLGYAVNVYHISEDAGWDLVYKTIYRVVAVQAGYEFENEQKLGSFLFKIFINYLRNHIRDERTRTNNAVFVSLDETRKDFIARADQASQDPKIRILNEELAKLEDWQRILLLLRSQEVSYSEIAAYVHKPEEQLKVYYQRLKNKLSASMQKRMEDLASGEKATEQNNIITKHTSFES